MADDLAQLQRLKQAAEQGLLTPEENIAFEGIITNLMSRQAELTDEYKSFLNQGGFTLTSTVDIDPVTGAAPNVRALVGDLPEMQPMDALATARQYYPDAQILPERYGYGKNQIVFTNPQTGQLTLFNPRSFDPGDIAGSADWAAEGVGGALGEVVGAAGGLALGGPPGALAGAVAGGGMGAAAGRETVNAGMRLLGRQDTRTMPQRALDIGITAGVNSVPIIGNALARAGLKTAARNTIAPIRNRLSGAGARDLIQDYTAAGIDPMASMISGNRAIQGATSTVAMTPGGAGVMQRASNRVEQQTAAYVDRVTRQFGIAPDHAVEVGEVIQRGFNNTAKRFQAQAAKAYDRVYKNLPADSPVQVSNALKLRDEIFQDYAATPELRARFTGGTMGILDDLAAGAAANDGRIPFRTLQRVRSDVGAALADPFASGQGYAQGDLKRIYGALSQDMEAAAMEAGPEAYKAFQAANRYFNYNLNNNMKFVNSMRKKAESGDSPEKLFDWLFVSGGKKAEKFMRNLAPEERDILAAASFRRMGLATAGRQGVEGDIFSPSVFLTNWNKMRNNGSFQALFGSSRYRAVAPHLDRIARIAASQKDALATFNTSNTGLANSYIQTLLGPLGHIGAGGVALGAGGVAAGVGGMGAMLGSEYLGARLLTSPRFAKWLADGLEIGPAKPNQLINHFARLTLITQLEPELAADVDQYYSAIQMMLNPPERVNPQNNASIRPGQPVPQPQPVIAPGQIGGGQ